MKEQCIQRALVLGMMCCLTLGSVPAQEVQLFRFSDISGALISEFQITRESLDSFGILARDTTRKILQGGIQLNTVGSIYHPNLLTFRAYINLVGLNTQRRLFTDESVNNSLNNSYNINLAFLQKKTLSFELFTLRQFSTADRAFLERYFITTQSTGFRVYSRAKFMPFRLELYKSDMLSESEIFRERDEKTKNINFRSDLIDADKSKSALTFRWKDYSEAVYGVDYQSLEAMANFLHSYGPKQRNRLLSLLSFHRLSGDFDIKRFQFANNAVQYLRNDLYLNGNYTFGWDDSFGRSFTRHRLAGSVNHRLYQSLTSSFQLGGRFEDSDFQKIRGLHCRIAANYSKRIPTGRILFNYLLRREIDDFSSRDGILSTSDTFDFSLSDTLVLSRPGIDSVSIRITDTDLTYVFLEGVDYQLDIINSTVVVSRLPGGAIEGSSKVLVHYDYLSYPDFRLRNRFDQFYFQLAFLNYFQAFYVQDSNKNTVISDYVIPPFESYDKKQIGAKFDARFLTLEYSREKRDSNLTNYRSWNFRASAGVRVSKALNLTGYLLWNRLKYEPEVFRSSYHARSFECSYAPRGNLTSALIYRKIHYSTNIYARVRESILFKFQWQIRKIILYFFYEHIFNRTENTARQRDFFSVMVRRTF
ncbi:MAG: hypothetical protein JXB23_08485 [Candidatus Aminicenantes bacterium]|nr:hypothetical protein [Candidatus Aminicenantes bacterium]